MLAARRLDPTTPVHPVCRAYIDYALSLCYEGYATGIVALWAQYRAYRDAWAWARPGAPTFRGVVGTWCSPGYDRFLRRLARAADAAMAEASAQEVRRAEEVFVQIAKYELAFWVMTMEENGPGV
jgi:thiaminase/transcriptional activator TenA